jgi:dissimilatory sulfite reductase (desulfoviridin) alpha/beta subunit
MSMCDAREIADGIIEKWCDGECEMTEEITRIITAVRNEALEEAAQEVERIETGSYAMLDAIRALKTTEEK